MILNNKQDDKHIFSNLQIGDRDLIGNKFNGHDLHLYLREKNIDSKHLVMEKESDDENTYQINNDFRAREFNTLAEEKYNIHSFSHYSAYDILYNELFLSSDLIHFHLIHNDMFNMHLLPLMSRIKPIVYSLHDPWLLSGHCVHHFNCNKWQENCGDCEFLDIRFPVNACNTALIFEMKRDIIERSNISFIVPSTWLYEKIKLSPIFKNKKIYKVPFGVNQDIFKSADSIISKRELGIDENSLVLMFRADENIYKGLDIIKKALTEIKTNKKITLITTACKGLMNDFKNYFDVFEYGWVKSDNLLAKLYQACDIFLMPSRVETFGMMAIEAMNCGKMVLALEGTSLPDVINSPYCGIACKESEYSSMLEKIINSGEYIERGKKSLSFALENYKKDRYVNKIIDVYKEVLKEYKTDEGALYVLNQLYKYKDSYGKKSINYDLLNRDYIEKIDYLTKENSSLFNENENLRLSSIWSPLFGISNNSKFIRITLFGIKININITKEIVNKIACFIPLAKLRFYFREKFKGSN